jgi:hypothetical protein
MPSVFTTMPSGGVVGSPAANDGRRRCASGTGGRLGLAVIYARRRLGRGGCRWAAAALPPQLGFQRGEGECAQTSGSGSSRGSLGRCPVACPAVKVGGRTCSPWRRQWRVAVRRARGEAHGWPFYRRARARGRAVGVSVRLESKLRGSAVDGEILST